jgi:hypothetical protein
MSAPGVAESFAEYFTSARHLPVFVVLGVQGSGTNLLRSILVEAFRFCVVQDQSIVFNAAARLGVAPSPEAVHRQFDRILMHLQPSAVTRKTRQVIKSNADYTGIEDCFGDAAVRSSAELAQFIYAYGAYRLGTTLMAVKSDDLWEHIDQIDAVVPNRRIVLLTRDFRDNLLSITKKDFGPIEPLVAAQYVHDRFARYEGEFQRTPPARRFHVRYEDLLSAPLGFAAAFAAHFGLEFGVEGQAGVGRLRIRSSNVRKWAGLDPETLSGCEGILRDELLRYGYGTERQGVPPSGGTWLLARGRDVVRRVPQKVLKVSRRLVK